MKKKGTVSSMDNINPKRIAAIAAFVIGFIVFFILMRGAVGKNDFQNYQIKQSLGGTVTVVDESGWYWKWWGTVWEYPRTMQIYWSSSKKEGKPEDESITVHFNDAGSAKISTMVQFNMPVEIDKRKRLHQRFGGNLTNIEHAVHAHLANCIKTTGPLMSASENQAARKSEFAQVVEEQLKHGLYQMRRVQVQLKDRVDDKGNPVFVEATEIVKDDKGVALRVDEGPLKEYGIEVTQFSITGTDYDDLTLKQFAAKQTAFLAAEGSKAQREQELQQKLMVVAQGERQVAEIEATANQAKAKAVTEATQKVEVAAKAKLEAETLANQKLEVAKIEKETAETKANQEAEVKRIEAEMLIKIAEAKAKAAEKEAEAIRVLAAAEEEKIKKAGAITEERRVLTQIMADRDAKVAAELAKIATPSTVIVGGGAGGQGQSMTEYLMNITLLKQLGIFQPMAVPPATEKK